MISKRHITARGHSVLSPKTPSPLTTGMSTTVKRAIFNKAVCCDVKLNPT